MPVEARRFRSRSDITGGTSNAGGVMGTGTGAGRTVGRELDEGTITAGFTDGATEE
jgi:hypothetical protein